MSVLSNVSSVAKYESKLLMRSWFYRIFLVLAILALCVFNFAYLVFPDNPGFWIMRALPSNIPYINLLLLNTGQAIIAVFLSSEFLKADKKLDTSEVFYVHPLSNAEYVAGKIWGNMNVFLRLNLIIIFIVVIFNLVSGLAIDWIAYLIYFLVISVPTLIYIFGLSIGLMLILKNQAITFVLLLGYIALTLFYIADKFYYLFDYMVYSLPLVKSSIVGFTNWSSLINHRLIYLLIGLGFICISIFLFRRLPNTKYGRYRWLALSFCFILAGFAAGYKHVNTFLYASNMRMKYTEINNKYVNMPQMVIENYDITVEQHPATISAIVVMHGTAHESSAVFTFCLNPSLDIREIKENGKDLSYTRDHQIILIDFGRVLTQGDTATWTISYAGRVDENFCYLDIPADLLQEKYTVESMFNVDKKYSFQTENYVLFTPETYWYPRPGVAFSSENPDWQRAYFSNYRLTVKTINGLQALSQGTRLEPREKIPTIRSNEFDSNDAIGTRQMGGMRMGGGGMGGFGGVIGGGFGGGMGGAIGGGGQRPQGQVIARQQGGGQGGGQPQGMDREQLQALREQFQQGGGNAGQPQNQEGQGTGGQGGQAGDNTGPQQGRGGQDGGNAGQPQNQEGQGIGGQSGNVRQQGRGGQAGDNTGPQQGRGGQDGGNAGQPQNQDVQGAGGQGNNVRQQGQGGQAGDNTGPQQGRGGQDGGNAGQLQNQEGQGTGGQGGNFRQQGQGGQDGDNARPQQGRGGQDGGNAGQPQNQDVQGAGGQGSNFRQQGSGGQDGDNARPQQGRGGQDGGQLQGMDREQLQALREQFQQGGANVTQQGQGGQDGDNTRPQQDRGGQDGSNVRPQQGQGGDFRAQGPDGDEVRGLMHERDDSLSLTRSDSDGIDIADNTSEITVDSIFIYQTDFPTPTISLIIGDYEQKSVEVDYTIFNIWHLKGNDYFASTFEAIADTIPYQIRLRRLAFESDYLLNYSFKRFSLVEVPVQFSSYVRTWTQAQETLQPEMVLFPEKGCLFNNLDITRQITLQKSFAKRMGRELSDDNAALSVLNNFLMTFQNAENRGDFSMDRGSINITTIPNPYFLFPQLYNFRYNIYSSDWTIANRLIELYLQNKQDDNRMRQMNGISNNEKANLLIQTRPFKELLNDPKQRDLLDNIISLKANVLFAPAELNVGFMEFRDSIRTYLNANRFTNIRFEDLITEMSWIAGEDLYASIATWDSPTKLPAYIVNTPEITYIINRDVEVYVVKLQITNNSDYDGIIDVETLFGRSAVDDPRAKRKISLAARETKLLVTVWDEAPRSINVNTLISANLPNLISIPVNNIAREQNIPIDREGDFILANVNYNLQGEVIVDNEDVGLFELSRPDIVGLLPQWLDQVGDNSFPYQGVQSFRPPFQWTLTTSDNYYGTHIRSAYVIKSGGGSQTATWKVPVPSKGLYDLYYYVNLPDELRRGQNTRGGFGGSGGGGSGNMEYHLKVHYDDGADDAYINLRRASQGWTRVGAYNFMDDTIKVVLSNDIANVRMVTADAVKIVKRDTSVDRDLDERPELARVE